MTHSSRPEANGRSLIERLGTTSPERLANFVAILEELQAAIQIHREANWWSVAGPIARRLENLCAEILGGTRRNSDDDPPIYFRARLGGRPVTWLYFSYPEWAPRGRYRCPSVGEKPTATSEKAGELLRLLETWRERASRIVGRGDGSPVDGAIPSTTAESVATLRPAVQRAWMGWLEAGKQFSKTPTDREAWDWVRESDLPEPQAFDTWAKHLRTARKILGQQKNTPRANREGRSIVRADQF